MKLNPKQTEWIGYLATFVLVISFAINDFMLFRVVNSAGCFLFIIYGLLKKAPPVTLTNFIIVAINLYYIFFVNSGN